MFDVFSGHFVSCIFLRSPSKPLVFFSSAVRRRQVASTCHHFCTQQSACTFLLAAGQEGLSQSAFGVCILPAEAHAYRSCTWETSSFGKYYFFLCSITLELRWAFHKHFCRSEYMRTCECKWRLLLHVLNLNLVSSKYWWSAFLYKSVVSVYCMFGLQVPQLPQLLALRQQQNWDAEIAMRSWDCCLNSLIPKQCGKFLH